ncbi:MAG: S8 family serine peptidase [Prochloron sp. SP5CPC1]|nr:S8 family serine peptidase [Candidatus Paraprochloron terpiosi SP5CPC1]
MTTTVMWMMFTVGTKVGNNNDPSPAYLFDSHGTSVAGVAAGKGNNGIGVSGADPEASLVGLRILSDILGTDTQIAGTFSYKNQEVEIYARPELVA